MKGMIFGLERTIHSHDLHPEHWSNSLSVWSISEKTIQSCHEDPTTAVEPLLAKIRPYSLACWHTNWSRRLHHLPEFITLRRSCKRWLVTKSYGQFAGEFMANQWQRLGWGALFPLWLVGGAPWMVLSLGRKSVYMRHVTNQEGLWMMRPGGCFLKQPLRPVFLRSL